MFVLLTRHEQLTNDENGKQNAANRFPQMHVADDNDDDVLMAVGSAVGHFEQVDEHRQPATP